MPELVRCSGMQWSVDWTDVPDDGNCMAHAFWLALKTLLEVLTHQGAG